MIAVTTELTWLQWLLEDFAVMSSTPNPLSSHSTNTLSIAWNLVKHELTKQICVDASYMRSHVHDQIVANQGTHKGSTQLLPFQTQCCGSPMSWGGGVLDIYSCVYFSYTFHLVG